MAHVIDVFDFNVVWLYYLIQLSFNAIRPMLYGFKIFIRHRLLEEAVLPEQALNIPKTLINSYTLKRK